MDYRKNVERLYGMVDNVEDFLLKTSKEFDVKPSTLRTNWFSRFEYQSKYGVPKRLVGFMQNYIRQQERKKERKAS